MYCNKIWIACLVISTLFSCLDTKTNENSKDAILTEFNDDNRPRGTNTIKDWTDKNVAWIDLPLDSARLISEMQLKDAVTRLDLIENDPLKDLLSPNLDTLIMRDFGPACTCPNWKTVACGDTSTINTFGGPCKYYIEPADPSLKITVPYSYAKHEVIFIGKKYLKPAADGTKGEASIGGNVFRYYSFEFIKPYLVCGPNFNDTLIQFGDTSFQTYTSKLWVR